MRTQCVKMAESDDEDKPSVANALSELRNAVVALAKTSDEHERRIAMLESEVETCRIGAQASARGIIELREREAALSTRLDSLDAGDSNLRLELGSKVNTNSLEALLKLKMDKKACEQLFADLVHSRETLGGRVEYLDEEVDQLSIQLRGLKHSASSAGSSGRRAAAALGSFDRHEAQQQQQQHDTVGNGTAVSAASNAAGLSTAIRPASGCSSRTCGSIAGGPNGVVSSGSAATYSLRPHSAGLKHSTSPAMPEPSDGSNYRRDHAIVSGVGCAPPTAGGSAMPSSALQQTPPGSLPPGQGGLLAPPAAAPSGSESGLVVPPAIAGSQFPPGEDPSSTRSAVRRPQSARAASGHAVVVRPQSAGAAKAKGGTLPQKAHSRPNSARTPAYGGGFEPSCLSVVGMGSGASRVDANLVGCMQTRFKPSRILTGACAPGGSTCGGYPAPGGGVSVGGGPPSPTGACCANTPHPSPQLGRENGREHPFGGARRLVSTGAVPPRSANAHCSGGILSGEVAGFEEYLQIGSACSFSGAEKRDSAALGHRVAHEMVRAGKDAMHACGADGSDRPSNNSPSASFVSSKDMGFGAAPGPVVTSTGGEEGGS